MKFNRFNRFRAFCKLLDEQENPSHKGEEEFSIPDEASCSAEFTQGCIFRE